MAKADGKVYDAMKFQLTDEQYNQCELLHNRHMYAGNEITHDLSYMRSMHFIKMLVELSKIVEGDIEWTEADIFMQYFNYQWSWHKQEVMPKFILLSGHRTGTVAVDLFF